MCSEGTTLGAATGIRAPAFARTQERPRKLKKHILRLDVRSVNNRNTTVSRTVCVCVDDSLIIRDTQADASRVE